MRIRKIEKDDWPRLWPLLEGVFREGETYAFSPDIGEEEAHRIWVEIPQQTYVAVEDDGRLIGSYFIKPNQPGLGSHVGNCGYLVAEAARGRGVARRLCEHSQRIAVGLGFRAMQYNLVVSTNRAAIHLWQSCGFQVVGALPGAFCSKKFGYVDALVMYKKLVE